MLSTRRMSQVAQREFRCNAFWETYLGDRTELVECGADQAKTDRDSDPCNHRLDDPLRQDLQHERLTPELPGDGIACVGPKRVGLRDGLRQTLCSAPSALTQTDGAAEVSPSLMPAGINRAGSRGGNASVMVAAESF
jgi:hypothetical protein